MVGVKAEIITIGDEILYGQTLDTNAHRMSQMLGQIGVKVIRRTTVGDEKDEILVAFDEAGKRADIILITGGLGPTSDDLTKPLLAHYFGCNMRLSHEALQDIVEYFERRGRELTEVNRLQAEVPEICTVLRNKKGTAPGMRFDKGDKLYISMPGVPHEMEHIMKEHVLSAIKEKYTLPVIFHKIIRTSGIGESWLADKIKDWEIALPKHMKLAYLPTLGQVKLRITAFGQDRGQLQHEILGQVEKLNEYASEYIYGYDDDELEVIIGQMLTDEKLTISIAESCSGGYVSHSITRVPGSSNYYKGGIVAYSNEVKVKELGIPNDILDKYGAVSKETVELMADNVRKKLGTDIGIASTGIAGPDGGTYAKPVGTVWIAYSFRGHVESKKLQLTNDRLINIQLTETGLLTMLFQQFRPKGKILSKV